MEENNKNEKNTLIFPAWCLLITSIFGRYFGFSYEFDWILSISCLISAIILITNKVEKTRNQGIVILVTFLIATVLLQTAPGYFIGELYKRTYSNTTQNNTAAYESPTTDQSGYELIYYAEKYLDAAKLMNKYVLEHDYDSVERINKEALKIIDQIDSTNVPQELVNAKKYLREGIWLDSFSFVMITSGMPKEDYEKTISDAMNDFYLFTKEMNNLGYNIRF
jgi:hypothetical protein